MSNEAGMKDVIVADNDYIVRGILRSILEREGFTVLQAVDGLEAIDYAMRVRAQLVILDYKMPRLDGFGACAQIRHLPGYADTPIAILTAFDNEDTRAAAERAGVTAVMAKPFKPVDLLRTIAAMLGPAATDGATAPKPFVRRLGAPAGTAPAVRRAGRTVRGPQGAEHLPPLKPTQ